MSEKERIRCKTENCKNYALPDDEYCRICSKKNTSFFQNRKKRKDSRYSNDDFKPIHITSRENLLVLTSNIINEARNNKINPKSLENIYKLLQLSENLLNFNLLIANKTITKYYENEIKNFILQETNELEYEVATKIYQEKIKKEFNITDNDEISDILEKKVNEHILNKTSNDDISLNQEISNELIETHIEDMKKEKKEIQATKINY